jgi:hypothetical protein
VSGWTFVEIEHPAKSLSSANTPFAVRSTWSSKDEQISDKLMVLFAALMGCKLSNSLAEPLFRTEPEGRGTAI